MSYAIIGVGAVDRALGKMFARKQMAAAVASRRSPEALTPVAKAIGTTIIAQSTQDAVQADIVLLAMPFGAQNDVAKAAESRHPARLAKGDTTMAKTDIERVLTIFEGISVGDVDLATQYIDHTRFVQHNPYATDGVEGRRNSSARLRVTNCS